MLLKVVRSYLLDSMTPSSLLDGPTVLEIENLEFLVIWEVGMVVGGHLGRLWRVEVES